MANRTPEHPAIWDGEAPFLPSCPRGRSDCWAMARHASPNFESYMCCGETHSAPIPTDVLRLCIVSTHETGVDVLVNLDKRDAVEVATVLLTGMAHLAQADALATGQHSGTREPEEGK